MTVDAITVDVRLTDAEWEARLASECAVGLTAVPKELSPVWFYDERGSALFDQITRLPEYYPTRCERRLLSAHAPEIAALAGADTLVELGSGTSDKTRCLLDAMVDGDDAGGERLERYVPFDVSEETVRQAADHLVGAYPGMRVEAVIGDFHEHLSAIPTDGRRVVAFLGGTIGNLDPSSRGRFLDGLAVTMDHGDHFLLGVDLVKDPEVLVRAYDDDAGVTAAFNRNALSHLNHRLAADFAPEAFDHVARWNPQESWIEIVLRSTRAQRAEIAGLGLSVSFERGEELRTEISAKFTPEGIGAELGAAGFGVVRSWTTSPGYLLVLARPT